MPVTFLSRFSVKCRLPGAAVALLLACAAPLLAPGTAGAAPNPSTSTAPSDAAATPTADTPAPGTTDAPATDDTPKTPGKPAGSESPKTPEKPSDEAPPKGTTEPEGTDGPKEETPKEDAKYYEGVRVKLAFPSTVSADSTVHAKITVTNTSSVEVGRIPLRAVVNVHEKFDGRITGSYRQPGGLSTKVTFTRSGSGTFSAPVVVSGGGHPGSVSTVDLAITFGGFTGGVTTEGSLTVGVNEAGGSQATQAFELVHGVTDMERLKLSLSGLPSSAVRGRPFPVSLSVGNPTDTDFRPLGNTGLFIGNGDDPQHISAPGFTPDDVVVEQRAVDGTYARLTVTQYAPGVLYVGVPHPGGKPHQTSSADVRVTVKDSAPAALRNLYLQFGMGSGYDAPKPTDATLPLLASGTDPDTSKPGSTQSRTDNVSVVTTPTTVPTGALPKTGASGDTPALVGAGGLLVLAGAGAVTASRARRRPQS